MCVFKAFQCVWTCSFSSEKTGGWKNSLSFLWLQRTMTLHRLRVHSGELASIFAAIFPCNLSWKWRMAEINPKLEDVSIDVLYCVKHGKKCTFLPKVQSIWCWVNGLLRSHCTKSSSWRKPCSIPWEHRDPCPSPSWCCSPRGQPGSHQIPPGITNHHFSSVCKKHKKSMNYRLGTSAGKYPRPRSFKYQKVAAQIWLSMESLTDMLCLQERRIVFRSLSEHPRAPTIAANSMLNCFTSSFPTFAPSDLIRETSRDSCPCVDWKRRNWQDFTPGFTLQLLLGAL